MSASQSSPNPIQPLSVGNVVSAGFRLYRSNLKLYFDISLKSTLWQLVPVALLIPVTLLFVFGRLNASALGLIIPIWIVLFVYCMAESITTSAQILRLAFGELASQPESVTDARRQLAPRKWIFFGANFLFILMLYGWLLFLYISAFFLYMAAFLLFSAAPNIQPQNNGGILIFWVLAWLAFLAILYGLIWFICRLYIFDVPLALESGMGARKTISRSWELTKGNIWRIFGISMVAFLMAIPFQIPLQIAASVIQGSLEKFFPFQGPTFLALSFILSYLSGLVVSLFVLPFWQSIKAVVYCDLRSRREGLGLQLGDRTI